MTVTRRIIRVGILACALALLAGFTPSTTHAQTVSQNEYMRLVTAKYAIENDQLLNDVIPRDVVQEAQQNWTSWNEQQRTQAIQQLEQEVNTLYANLSPQDQRVYASALSPGQRSRLGQGETFAGVTGDSANVSAGDAECSIWAFSFDTCIWRPVAANIGGMLMMVGGFVLGFAGLAFDFLLNKTVIAFKELYDALGGINIVWGQLRNIANIGIIGGFVFVAFATILGVEEYGARRFIINLLIAAVLINFSLFFTQVIIDTSNYTARQFLQPIISFVNDGSGAQAQNPSGGLTEPTGVAGVFFRNMGITSVWESGQVMESVANQYSGGTAILYGIVGMILFVVAAAVLGYGAFLLLVRAISLIILLMVSALAFASFAIPRLTGLWSMWWKLLLTNAFFAPLLAILLWATVYVMDGLGSAGGSLGNLIANPNAPVNLNSFFSYLIVVGLLFASIKIAHSLSLTGANAAPGTMRGLWAGAGTLGFAGMAGALGLGWMGRQSVGRYASGRYDRLRDMAEKEAEKGKGADKEKIRSIASQMRRMDSLRNMSFNALQNKGVKTAARASGAYGLDAASGVGAGGFQPEKRKRSDEIEGLVQNILRKGRLQAAQEKNKSNDDADTNKPKDEAENASRDAAGADEAKRQNEQQEAAGQRAPLVASGPTPDEQQTDAAAAGASKGALRQAERRDAAVEAERQMQEENKQEAENTKETQKRIMEEAIAAHIDEAGRSTRDNVPSAEQSRRKISRGERWTADLLKRAQGIPEDSLGRNPDQRPLDSLDKVTRQEVANQLRQYGGPVTARFGNGIQNPTDENFARIEPQKHSNDNSPSNEPPPNAPSAAQIEKNRIANGPDPDFWDDLPQKAA